LARQTIRVQDLCHATLSLVMSDQPVLSRRFPDALRPYTGLLLSKLGASAQKQFATRLETLGLTTRMWGTLNVLDGEGAVTQHALCKAVGVDPSSMVATIDELEKRGLVERRRHPVDRRAHALHVTDDGLETLARGRELARQAQDELLAPLDAEERERLHELLLALAVAGDPPGGPT
jgi:DNA-binding MarR family transcriptional regulator